MITIFKLINGEEIIGDVEGSTDAYYNVSDPMSIIGIREDSPFNSGLRLRNTLVLSEEEFISVPLKSVVIQYKPSKPMCEYYLASVQYNKMYVNPEVNKQIVNSAKELKHTISELHKEDNDPFEDFGSQIPAKGRVLQ